MTRTELVLASRLLSLASDSYSNHGCNDMPPKMFLGMTKDELIKLEDHAQRGDDEDSRPYKHISDWEWMDFLAARLRAEAEKTEN